MTIRPDGAPMSDANMAIMERGNELTTELMAFIGVRTDANDNMDVRVLALALGNVLGCYMHGMSDKEHKINFARHFCLTFFACAGVPLRVEVVS